MSKKINSGRMFELTNQTFANNFSYIFILAALFIAAAFVLTWVGASVIPNSGGLVAVYLLMLLMVVVYAKLAVMIHRLIILDEKGLEHLLRWSMTEVKFIGWLLLVFTIVITIMYGVIYISFSSSSSHTGGAGFGPIMMLILMVIMGVVFSRFALIFPATAAAHPLTLSESWQMTSEHKFFMFFLAVLVPYITNRILQKIPEGQLIWTLVIEVISVLVVIYEVGLISHAYESLREKDNEEAYLSELD